MTPHEQGHDPGASRRPSRHGPTGRIAPSANRTTRPDTNADQTTGQRPSRQRRRRAEWASIDATNCHDNKPRKIREPSRRRGTRRASLFTATNRGNTQTHTTTDRRTRDGGEQGTQAAATRRRHRRCDHRMGKRATLRKRKKRPRQQRQHHQHTGERIPKAIGTTAPASTNSHSNERSGRATCGGGGHDGQASTPRVVTTINHGATVTTTTTTTTSAT